MDEQRLLFLSWAHQRLLHQLMSNWHRRGSRLLQIGLNAGIVPDLFWEAGFDVTVMDRSAELLDKAREHSGSRVDYVCGDTADTPFENGEFEYTVLLHPNLHTCASSLLAETARITSQGILILTWNRFSLPGVPSSLKSAFPHIPSDFPWNLYRLVHCAYPEWHISFMSILPFWECLWSGSPSAVPEKVRNILAPFNLAPLPIPLGSLLGIRADGSSVPLTPVGMLRTAAESLYPSKLSQESLSTYTKNTFKG